MTTRTNSVANRELGEIKVALQGLSDRFESLSRKIDGNGRPGLSEIVSNQQLMLEAHRKSLEEISQALVRQNEQSQVFFTRSTEDLERFRTSMSEESRQFQEAMKRLTEATSLLKDQVESIRHDLDEHTSSKNLGHQTIREYVALHPYKSLGWLLFIISAIVAIVEVNEQTDFLHKISSLVLKTP